jgi:pimeloyl-ACP methyl ester carboxylesterase
MRVLTFAIALVVSLLSSGCALANFALLWPPSGPQQASGAQRRVVKPAPHGEGSTGKDVEVWIAPASNGAKANAYALRFYGNADRAEWHVAMEASQFSDVEFWGVNYPGYGGSEGPATLRGVARAALLAYDDLAREAAGRPIYAFGTSLGTTAALHVARERDVRGLVLVNPPPLRRLVLEEHGWWNLFLLAGPTALGIPDELDSEANARRCHAPAVFVTAERDEIVPLGYQGHVIRAYAGPKEVIPIPNATHNDAPPPETMARITEAVARMRGRDR